MKKITYFNFIICIIICILACSLACSLAGYAWFTEKSNTTIPQDSTNSTENNSNGADPTEEPAIISHEHHYILASSNPSTCSQIGFNIYTCEDCGRQKKEYHAEYASHEFNEEIYEVYSNCYKRIKYTCKNCNYYYLDYWTGHDFYNEPGNTHYTREYCSVYDTYQKCHNCDYFHTVSTTYGEKHDYSETPATYTTDFCEAKLNVCSKCHFYKYNEDLDVLASVVSYTDVSTGLVLVFTENGIYIENGSNIQSITISNIIVFNSISYSLTDSNVYIDSGSNKFILDHPNGIEAINQTIVDSIFDIYGNGCRSPIAITVVYNEE